MFNKQVSNLLLIVILCTLCSAVFSAQSLSSSLSISPRENRNLYYREPKLSTCACIGCTCGSSCPQSISAHSYVSFNPSCPSGQVVSSLNINVESTDGSTFKYLTMKPSEFTNYKSGKTSYYYAEASNVGSLTCIDSGPYSFTDQSLVVVVECTNVIYSCPLKYSVSSGCTTATGNTVTIAGISMSVPSTVNSGQTFSTTARLVDTSGSTITTASGSVTLSWEGTGTFRGSTVVQFSSGVASFSNSITVSSTATNMLKATYVIGDSTYSQSRGVTVQTGSAPVDYTSAWVGTWKVVDGCDVNTCCCLTGSVSVTKTNTNTVFLTSPVSGLCVGSSAMSASVTNIDSDTTLKATIFGNPFTLTRNGKDLTVVNDKAGQCSGRATKTSNSSALKSNMLLAIGLMLFIISVLLKNC